MKNKVNEWQELSLKKDIEKIIKIISRNQSLSYALLYDFSIAILAVIFNLLFTPEDIKGKTIIIIISTVLCIIPFGIMFIRWIIKKGQESNSVVHTYKNVELIDLFDNEICYYIMTAESYKIMLEEAIIDNENNNMRVFYFIETWFYINKTKTKLYSMMYKIRSVFSSDIVLILKNNMISIDRLSNILMIIKDISDSLNLLLSNKSVQLCNHSIIDLNEQYNMLYLDFIEQVRNEFKIEKDDYTLIPKQ